MKNFLELEKFSGFANQKFLRFINENVLGFEISRPIFRLDFEKRNLKIDFDQMTAETPTG